MATIKLTRGYEAEIDIEDIEKVEKFKWRVNICRGKKYAVRERKKEERVEGIKLGTTISLHRFILGIHLLGGFAVIGDHKDGDGLNCHRWNLRACSTEENGRNRRICNRDKSSRYKGVYKMKNRPGYWQAYIKPGKKKKHLGTLDSELDAAKLYDVYAVKYFGVYANLNFPQGGVPF